jgi:hypothetical protein
MAFGWIGSTTAFGDEWADMARAGCLIGYGPSRAALRRRMAGQIAQNFRSVPPGNIPIARPTVFEPALNPGGAKSPDLNVPNAVLASADEVIEQSTVLSRSWSVWTVGAGEGYRVCLSTGW